MTVAALGGVLVRLPRRAGGYVDSIALWGVTLFQWTSSALPAAGELSVCRRRAWLALLLPRDPPAAWWLGGPGSSFVSWLLWCLSPLRWDSQVLSRAGSWLPQGKQSPSVPPDCARPPGARRMAKEFMLPPGRCGLQPAASSPGGSGHFGSGSCFLLWDDGIVPPQGPLPRRGVLRGGRVGAGQRPGTP